MPKSTSYQVVLESVLEGWHESLNLKSPVKLNQWNLGLRSQDD